MQRDKAGKSPLKYVPTIFVAAIYRVLSSSNIVSVVSLYSKDQIKLLKAMKRDGKLYYFGKEHKPRSIIYMNNGMTALSHKTPKEIMGLSLKGIPLDIPEGYEILDIPEGVYYDLEDNNILD